MRSDSKPVVSSGYRLLCSSLLLVWLTLATSSGLAQDYSIEWQTIDGGGELGSETADKTWQLSGTIGQPDGTESLELSGNGWTLTGGFWPVTVDQTDVLFRDGYEGEDAD